MNTDNSNKLKRAAHLPFLIYICIASALGGLLWGFDAIVISGTISQVKGQFGLSSLMEGLFVSSGLIGAVIGAGVAGILSDKLGRRRNLVIAASLLLVSAIGSALANRIDVLIVARLIGGLGVGLSAMVCPVYISEISPAHLRGRLVTVFQLAITVGIMLSLFNNAGLNSLAGKLAGKESVSGFINWILVDETWRAMFASEVLPGIIFFLMTLTIPESPRWLIKDSRSDEATVVLNRIYVESAGEVGEEIRLSLQEESNRQLPLGAVFAKPYNKFLVVAIGLAVFAQFSGINVVFYYGPTVLEDAGFGLGKALGGMAVIGFFNMIFTFIAIACVDRFGRKRLLQIGTIGAILCLIGIGAIMCGSSVGMLLIVLICGFVGFFAFSLGPIKFIFASEIFPTQVRAHAMSVVILSLWGADTLVGQFFPLLRDNLGAPVTFWIFAGILALQIPLIWKCMPETAGKTLEEIEKWYED